MSGHSKWHNIKRKKGVNDAAKSILFSKMSRLITVAARQGGGDVNANPTLRLAVQRAKDARMPNDNIDKAIKKGTGEDTSTHYEEVTYEGFGPEGGALLIKTITDNKNRTVSELRNIFNRAGGSLGGPGSAAYIFAQDPQNPTYKVTISHEDKAEAIDGLIETLEDHDDVQEVYHNYDF